ncbi:glycosyltransferase family 2 protein [Rasiella rasia]|uniref:Glycosyltransferase family 2 protein n=1 Tax=Rasiella rasia TaxID=2744027 RepID=A0A6G6GKN2_9FLAO|nr:glycosyltransferase family 2 protein [Rasiella rasia]QIE59077.1 glycosyltransferase family 2 protein [Rasiella rasia]
MLSILIPTYNHSVYSLVQALDNEFTSLNITYEILVFDDGSTLPLPDNEKITSFAHVKFQKLKQNIGRSAIRKKLAENAIYETILFLDADVLPVSPSFIDTYYKAMNQGAFEVIFGGVAYAQEKPKIDERLRWEYGRQREVKAAAERQKAPHFIITQNVLLKKKTFLELSIPTENFYGDDLVFSQQLKTKNINVLHIENPVFHLGLESSQHYLKKALSAVKSIVALEDKGVLDPNLTKLQQTYVKLKKLRMLGLFTWFFSKKKAKMKENFTSASPNLKWFDLYRLLYYIELKSKSNA